MTGKAPSARRACWARMVFTGKGRPLPQLDAVPMPKRVAGNPRAIAYVDGVASSAGMRIRYAPGPPWLRRLPAGP